MAWKRRPELLGLREPRTGPGISRPRPGDRTQVFRVLVTPDRGRPLLWVAPAIDAEQAVVFAKNRWPNYRQWEVVGEGFNND